jgi:hypothetical protein
MQATSRAALTIALAFPICSLFPATATASHHTFSSSVERFEVDGNAFGPADGTLDFVDEFDNGTIAPDWTPLLGTAVETGDAVQLKNPGTDYEIGGLSVDVSNIENATDIDDGAGDFVASAYWTPVIPVTGAEFHFQTYALTSTIEAAGLSFTNAAPGSVDPPAIAGPAIVCQLTRIDGTGYHDVSFQPVAIDPQGITGRIVFRLAFDDATNMLSCSYSLDGGTTFQSPFSPVPILTGLTSTEFLLGAGVQTESGPPPPPTTQTVPTQLLLVKKPNGALPRKIVYQAKAKAPNGNAVVGNPITGGAKLKVKLDGATQCFDMPAAGWKPIGAIGFKYADPKRLRGPVTVAEIKRTPSGIFQQKAIVLGKSYPIDVVPPNPGAQGDTNFQIGGGAEYCGSTLGGKLKPNDGKTFKATNAPAPGACNVTACP